LRVVKSSPKYKRPWLPLPRSPTNRQATFLRRASLCTRRSNSPPFAPPVSDRSVRSSSGGVRAVRPPVFHCILRSSSVANLSTGGRRYGRRSGQTPLPRPSRACYGRLHHYRVTGHKHLSET
jgi:hypothetical protein